MMLGEYITSSRGKYPRHVYEHECNSAWIVKVIEVGSYDENIREWEFWNNSPPHIKKWLVPCISIHENGKYLVMEKGKQPVKVPEEFCEPRVIEGKVVDDIHNSCNWVDVGGRTLLADYNHPALKNRIWLSE